MSTFTRKLNIDGVPSIRYSNGTSAHESIYTKKKTRGRNYYIQTIRKNGEIVNIVRHLR